MEATKIITTTVNTIIASISKGQFIRNGGNRLFQITQVNDTQVVLTSVNGEKEKFTIFSKEVFAKLFRMGNFVQVTSPERFVSEMIESRKTGADRFLVR
jgi:hypothetical protein